MSRDNFKAPTRRLLAERAAYKCSNPDCNKITVGPSLHDKNKASKPGIAAHISAAAKGGPRYDKNQTTDERESASNGIWLCPACAALIDKNNGNDFSVKLLRQWKESHELNVFNELSTGISSLTLTGWCEEYSGKWKLFVKNPSVVPFYDVVVYGYKIDSTNNERADIEVVFGTIPPRQTMDDVIDYHYLHSDCFGHPLIELEYTDSEANDWRKDYCGKLTRIGFRRPFD